MTEFIGGDAAGYFLEHGLVRRIANCAVERRGPRLDDTAGDNLAAAAAAHRALLLVVEMRRAIAGLETGECRTEIERRIGKVAPAAQRKPVRALFYAPPLDIGERLCAAIPEDALEVIDIGVGIELDERGGLHGCDKRGLCFARIETIPMNIVQRPAGAIDLSCGHACLKKLSMPDSRL